MIGNIVPPALPGGYIPPEIITGDTDRLVISAKKQTLGAWSKNFTSDGYEFPSGTAISLRREKTINMTKVGGRQGTIKEMSGLDDWEINISFDIYASLYGAGIAGVESVGGTIKGFKLEIESMIKKLKNLKSIWEQEKSLYVYQYKLNSMGIEMMILKRLEIPDPNSQWSQEVKILAYSDTEYDIENIGD